VLFTNTHDKCVTSSTGLSCHWYSLPLQCHWHSKTWEFKSDIYHYSTLWLPCIEKHQLYLWKTQRYIKCYVIHVHAYKPASIPAVNTARLRTKSSNSATNDRRLISVECLHDNQSATCIRLDASEKYHQHQPWITYMSALYWQNKTGVISMIYSSIYSQTVATTTAARLISTSKVMVRISTMWMDGWTDGISHMPK